MEAIPEDQPLDMEVDQVEPEEQEQEDPEVHAAIQCYPDLDPDAAKLLFLSAGKIAQNCRSVEHSRLIYMTDSRQSWNFFHIPKIRQAISDNVDIRNYLRRADVNIINNDTSGIGGFMQLKHRGFDYMYAWCLQFHAEGPEKKKRAGSSS